MSPAAPVPGFDALSPSLSIEAVEETYALRLDGSVFAYPSYINRVYGLRTEEGEALVVKFYRPGRWTFEALLEEHRLIADCAEAEIPVVPPLAAADGSTLGTLELEIDDGTIEYHFALFPKKGGRSFDAESETDWRRLGSLTGRLHSVAAKSAARHRLRFDEGLVKGWIDELRLLVHPEIRDEFEGVVSSTLALVLPRLRSMPVQRIHGDLHRGNILERPGEGLLLIDFDDCMMGPPVQDLWLLLPDRASKCERELGFLLEGYGEFASLEPGSVGLIEALRLLRMLHFLAWRARQRNDAWFAAEFPEWGGRGYWSREVESLREQVDELDRELDRTSF